MPESMGHLVRRMTPLRVAAVVCSLFVQSSACAQARGADRGEGIMGLFILGFLVLCVAVFIAQYRRLRQMRAMNYQWYRQAYQSCVKGNQVICHTCGGNRIQVRGLMNRTFLREHFCTQCGKTLYYSPEAT